MAGEGRPTLCTDKLTKVVCEGLRKGLGVRASVARAAISAVTHYEWLKKAETGAQPYANYRNACEKATSEFIDSKVTQVDEAAKDPRNWQAAAWRLERLFPDDFGRRDRQDLSITGKDGGPIQFGPDLSSMTPEAFAEYCTLQSRIAELTREAAKRGPG